MLRGTSLVGGGSIIKKWKQGPRIEQATYGLRSSSNPLTDNLTPQENTNQVAPEMGVDGASLSCSGNSVVAGSELEADEKPL